MNNCIFSKNVLELFPRFFLNSYDALVHVSNFELQVCQNLKRNKENECLKSSERRIENVSFTLLKSASHAPRN